MTTRKGPWVMSASSTQFILPINASIASTGHYCKQYNHDTTLKKKKNANSIPHYLHEANLSIWMNGSLKYLLEMSLMSSCLVEVCLPNTASLKLRRCCEHGTTKQTAGPSSHPTVTPSGNKSGETRKGREEGRCRAAYSRNSCLWTRSLSRHWLTAFYTMLKSPSPSV